MKKSRFSEEQMVTILREADRTTVAEAAKKHKVSGPTIYAWRKHFGQLEVADIKRLKVLELENSRLKKLLPPINMSVAELARQENISEVTLYNWRKHAKDGGSPVPGDNKLTDEWPAEAKFAVVLETAALSEIELSEYCRRKGLYPEQVQQWRQACILGQQSARTLQQAEKAQAKADKKRIRQLEQELRRKDKALAEAAALLILQKKLDAYWSNVDEDN